MKKSYEVFAALHEDSNEGWIWMPEEKGFNSRDYIAIESISAGDKVTCVCRIIDGNYLEHHKKESGIDIEKSPNPIVINAYYRDKLGRLETKRTYDFEIKKVWKFNYYRKIKAMTQHPNNYVKIATWLALWSVFLGSTGVILGVISLFKG